MTENIISDDPRTLFMNYQEEKERLESENAELKAELRNLSVLTDSSFLPLKPDKSKEKSSSEKVIAPSSTLTSLSSSSTTYNDLPNHLKLTSTPKRPSTMSTKIPEVTDADDNATFTELRPEKSNNSKRVTEIQSRSLSEGALSYDQFSERFSTTPQRLFESGRQVEIGRHHNHSDTTIGHLLQHNDSTVTESTISKRLNFDNASNENLGKTEKSPEVLVKNIEKREVGENIIKWKERIVGEIAFQLDRRILQYIFSHRRRLYGFTVRNISEKIAEIGSSTSGECDVKKIANLNLRKNTVMSLLRNKADFDPNYHPLFSELLVNKYGILKTNNVATPEQRRRLVNVQYLADVITEVVEPEYRKDAVVLLRALNILSVWDKKPTLMW